MTGADERVGTPLVEIDRPLTRPLDGVDEGERPRLVGRGGHLGDREPCPVGPRQRGVHRQLRVRDRLGPRVGVDPSPGRLHASHLDAVFLSEPGQRHVRRRVFEIRRHHGVTRSEIECGDHCTQPVCGRLRQGEFRGVDPDERGDPFANRLVGGEPDRVGVTVGQHVGLVGTVPLVDDTQQRLRCRPGRASVEVRHSVGDRDRRPQCFEGVDPRLGGCERRLVGDGRRRIGKLHGSPHRSRGVVDDL